ncbi:MAG: DUF2079 domain-containing protein [Myxococcota bacterium]
MTRRQRILVGALAGPVGVAFAALGLARYETFHNRTFDLAMYARMAWGLARGNLWDPVVGGHFFGLHLSPVLAPIGMLGWLFDTARVALVVQAVALAAAAFPLARIGARRFGTWGAFAGAAAFLFHPNIGHVAGYEFHPGTLAVLPLAWGLDALDRRDGGALAWATFGVLLCREDLGLITALMAGWFLWAHRKAAPGTKKGAWVALALSFFVLVLFFAVLHPIFAPPAGSMEAHFGKWGGGLARVLVAWMTDPGAVLAHLSTPPRLAYLPMVLGTVAFLPLLAPRWLLFMVPVVGINLMSDFPTTTDLDVHYVTPAVPVLVAGALDGASRLAAWVPRAASLGPTLLFGAVVVAHGLAGGTPLSADFDRSQYVRDARTDAARRVVAAIPPHASVQAPDALLPHLAERESVRRGPPPERVTDYVVLDLWHRERFHGEETVLRTREEPNARNWIARPDHAVVLAAGPFVVLERGGTPRRGLGGRFIVGTAPVDAGVPLTSCLAVLGAEHLGSDRVAFDLVARAPCWRDMALRIGTRPRPTRAELPFDGLLSGEHLRRGDRLRSVHTVPGAADARVVHIGVVRSSGSKAEHGDPYSVAIDLTH